MNNPKKVRSKKAEGRSDQVAGDTPAATGNAKKGTESAFGLCVAVEPMGFRSYIVVAEFHTRADAIEAMKQVVAEVTAPSLDEEGCQIYHWPQSADDPTLFLLYMEWRDKGCFEAHIATPHVKHAEDRLKREKMLIEPAKEWHFHRLIDGPRGRGYKKL